MKELNNLIQFKFEKKTDSETKREYYRLTPPKKLAHHPYFYLNFATKDSENILLTMNLDGSRNFYLLNLKTAIARQITFYTISDNLADFGGRISNDDKYIIYNVNNQIIRKDIETLEEVVIYKPQNGFDTYTVPDLSKDGKYMITIDFETDGYVNKDNSNWESFKLQSKLGLRSKLVLVDIDKKQSKVLLDTKSYPIDGVRKNQWLGHPQIRPLDNSTIMYCHEGYGGTVDARIWMIDSDGKNIRCARPHEYAGEIISHEFFTHDGEKIGFVRIENDKSSKGSLRMVDIKNLKEEIVVSLPRCSHFISNRDDKYLVADADYPAEPYIYLIDIKSGEVHQLLKHNSSMKSYGNTQDVHPHPCFLPNNKSIIFASDMDGYPAVYLTNVDDIVVEN